MYVISITYKTAPVEIREKFCFKTDEKEEFLKQIFLSQEVDSCVLLSTCNRVEVYFTGYKSSVEFVQKAFAEYKKIDLDFLRSFIFIYQDSSAIKHLFKVTCGMDSMAFGEDEILGQVKEAYEFSLIKKTTNYELNMLFQSAISSAKKIKTETKISKIPISIATLAANEAFKFSGDDKKLLIIGATGKMGSTIIKNLSNKKNIKIYGTARIHNNSENSICINIKMVDYHERYKFMDKADIIISATTSPHYTITYRELLKHILTEKKRLFIDLAVPMDIDKKVKNIPKTMLYDIDFFEQVSKKNGSIIEEESIFANEILEKYVDNVKKDMMLRDFIKDLNRKKIDLNRDLKKSLFKYKNKSTSLELKVLLDFYKFTIL